MGEVDTYQAQFETELWKKWEPTPYPLICPGGVQATGYGADCEPHSSLWMAHLAEGMGEWFREGMTLLDYGCGAGRFGNFLSGRLRNFTYYGLEPLESLNGPGYGKNGVLTAIEAIGGDSRILLGYTGTGLELASIARTDVVLLGSIFTHLTIEHSLAILRKLKSVVDRGGIIVYTVILSEEYKTIGPGGHGMADCFSLVTNTAQQFEGWGKPVGVYRTMYGSYDQTVYRVEP